MLRGIRVVEAPGHDRFAVDDHDLVVHQAGWPIDEHGNSGGAKVVYRERVVVVAAIGELSVVNDRANIDAPPMRLDESSYQGAGRDLVRLDQNGFARGRYLVFDRSGGVASAGKRRREARFDLRR